MNHITYTYNYFIEGKRQTETYTSKVYGTYYKRFPSGMDTMIKVWNPRLNRIITVRERTDLVKVID